MTPEQRAREFVTVGFRDLGVPLEPYVQIIAELITGALYDETVKLRAEIESLRDQVKTLRELREYDRKEIERLQTAIAYVRQRSQRTCEILNEFDNTREPKP